MGQHDTIWNKIKQDSARQYDIWQYMATLDSRRKDKIIQHNTVQDKTRQYKTRQNNETTMH